MQGGFAVAVTSNHAGQGLFSLLRVKNRKGGAGLMVVDFFGDMPMSITQGGDLGEVGNENNLLVASHFREHLAHPQRGFSRDAGINFVKNAGVVAPFFAHQAFEGQEQAGFFSTAGHLSQGSGFLTGVGAEPQLGLVQALEGILREPSLPVYLGGVHRGRSGW